MPQKTGLLVSDDVAFASVIIEPDTEIGIAFVAKCLVSLASLLPHAADLRQVGKDVTRLAHRMSKCELDSSI